MRILVVCSGLDFINYTRRATIEAIQRLNPDLEILMYNSVLNFYKKKNISPGIKFRFFYFWAVESIRKYKVINLIERFFKINKWKAIFNRFDIIFFIDPNQYYLLQFLSEKNRLIYLLRDPSVLQDKKNFNKELAIINRADSILGISKELCSFYFSKYYNFIPTKVHLWPNTVDMNLWDYNRWKKFQGQNSRAKIGLAGNINYVIDLNLLTFLAQSLPEFDFEIAGKVELNGADELKFQNLLQSSNVRFLGFISYDEFPALVINWDIGLVAAKCDHEYARYLNNNKQYQYMALGKPFVSYRFNADYDQFKDLVFIAENMQDFIIKIKAAILKSKDKSIITKGIKIASEQSSDIRAKQFIEIANSL